MELSKILKAMTLQELRTTHKKLVTEIKDRHAQAANKAVQRFQIGDLVEFVDHKKAEKVRMRVVRIGSTIQGTKKHLVCEEMTASATTRNVSPNICRLVGS